MKVQGYHGTFFDFGVRKIPIGTFNLIKSPYRDFPYTETEIKSYGNPLVLKIWNPKNARSRAESIKNTLFQKMLILGRRSFQNRFFFQKNRKFENSTFKSYFMMIKSKKTKFLLVLFLRNYT